MIGIVTQPTDSATAVREQYIRASVSTKEIDFTQEIEPIRAYTTARPRVHGKFILIGDEKFYIKGVTYGSFKPDSQGVDYPSASIVKKDFGLMRANGVNCVRTYTVPPLWLL